MINCPLWPLLIIFKKRRLSKETVKQYGRHIGKIVHSNPTIAFTIIIDQLQSYDNQIPHVVDASRYLTELEFDVLAYCMLEALSNTSAERIQSNGTSLAKWLISLSTFCGTLWRKHPIELEAILQYVASQLAVDNVYDLIVLQELIGQMSGIRSIEETTDAQKEALAGSDNLRREVFLFEGLRTTKKSVTRLANVLVQGKLVQTIGILIAQQRKEIVFRGESKELKVLGWMFDHVSLNRFFLFSRLIIIIVSQKSYTVL